MIDNLEFRVKALEDRVTALESATGQTSQSLSSTLSKKLQSPKEFLLTKKTKNMIQKTLVLAYYFESIAQHGAFNVNDLETTFRNAKEKLPVNMNDTVNKTIKRGLFVEHDERKGGKKSWMLTATGEKFVENNLSEE